MPTDRSLVIVGAAVAAIIVAAILAVTLRGTQETEVFPATTPEGALQRYLQAWDADDLEAAYSFFSDEVRGRMSFDDFQQARDDNPFDDGIDRARRVIFERTVQEGESARVELTVETISGEGLSASTYRSPYEIRMVREAGAWRIVEPLVWLDPAPIFDR